MKMKSLEEVMAQDISISAKKSKKNFVLVNEAGQTVWKFCRINDNLFSLEFSYPLSVFQAYALALTTFEFKV